MRSYIKLLSAVVLFAATMQIPVAMAQTALAGCAAKRQAITTQIQQTQDDPGRLAGLEKSLDHVNAHCKDTNLTKQRNRKVIKAQVRVNEAQHALDQAQTEQRSETKLAKLRAKLDSAKAELADAEAALKQ